MNNKTFYNLLHDVKDDAGKRPRWTLEKIAAALFCNRNYLNDVINNKVTGTNIRKRVIDFFEKQFEPWRVKRMLEALGWSDGENRQKTDVPCGTTEVRDEA